MRHKNNSNFKKLIYILIPYDEEQRKYLKIILRIIKNLFYQLAAIYQKRPWVYISNNFNYSIIDFLCDRFLNLC